MASSSVQQQPATARAVRLIKLFDSYTKGSRTAKTASDGKLFLEAICGKEDRVACVERLVASDNALDALKLSLRFDTSPAFLNGEAKEFLRYLQDPLLEQLCNGTLQRQLFAILVQPPTLWTALVNAHLSGQLLPDAELAFAKLLLDLLLWVDSPLDVTDTAKEVAKKQTLTKSDDRDVRTIGYRVEHIVQSKSTNESTIASFGPGGRHDNDFADYRRIAIYPTADELTSDAKPFLRRAETLGTEPLETRANTHLDNQFRLLREDFLFELRDELKTSHGKAKSRRAKTKLRGLTLKGGHYGKDKARQPFGLVVTFKHGVQHFTNLDKDARKKFLKDNPKFLRHQSFGALTDDEQIVAFASMIRVDELLFEDDPMIVLQIHGTGALEKCLTTLRFSETVDFTMIDASAFAYEPILQCLQSKVELPLWRELLVTDREEAVTTNIAGTLFPSDLAEDIRDSGGEHLQDLLELPKPVTLDESQLESLLTGLTQTVSLIQGPPGTGKSFIGALVAKAFHDHTSEKILVLSYTNHALDQFLEDLLDIGIPSDRIVRLGSKSTPRTKPLSLFEQQGSRRPPQEYWNLVNKMDHDVAEQERALDERLSAWLTSKPSKSDILEWLEFHDEDSDFFAAFQVPQVEAGETLVGRGGRAVQEHYLLDEWLGGRDAGVFRKTVIPEHDHVWQLNRQARVQKMRDWENQLLQEWMGGISNAAVGYSAAENSLRKVLDQRQADIIGQKQVIACTTTAAAKYTSQLQSAAPGIILVEEAGEILESHVLTAMTPSTKQIILIGDHKQLRPKVNNYALTVERNLGFDLNRSLFERLIRVGFPHTTLEQQHRMCPEISSLVRTLTYPNLVDAPSTKSREALRGIRQRVVFLDHNHGELVSDIADRRDEGLSVSKQNTFEAAMVLKTVRYLAQQGYGTADQVVLTPYLGQLSLLRQELARENDPVLNDIDSADLVKAGALSAASAAKSKRPIRLSTIDNYQGEESDIVIVSLTRSNPDGEIGFMSSPERLNVLLSRARKAVIIIGNSDTFLASKKGAAVWKPLIDMLAESNSIYDGLPVRCEQHPDHEMLLKSPEEFDEQCPEGGCAALCGAALKCGQHTCQRQCHKLVDQSHVKCDELVSDECPKKHKITWRCSALRPASCSTCDTEKRIAEQKRQRDLELDRQRQLQRDAYLNHLASIDLQIDDHQQSMKDRREAEQQQQAIRQREKDLSQVRAQAARQAQDDSVDASTTQKTVNEPRKARQGGKTDGKKEQAGGMKQSNEDLKLQSSARAEWEYEKSKGAKDESLDTLMDMVGLESVKDEFLGIKSKIDLAVRQGTDLGKDRFGAALLGNPGTGKTTVARLYAKFLTSVGALPGSHFVETTGAKLANEGVQGCKKMLDDIQNAGGGALFIDEAYQLTSGASYGGGAVLDFLLAEVENLTGKVVFIIAGYDKQMESFFAHNPGIPSRFPKRMQFADYEDKELLEIFNYGLEKRYRGDIEVEDGSRGLYARIFTRRLGRGRGKPGFGNARAVENNIQLICDRQSKRIRQERRAGSTPDDLFLNKEDLIGPEPADKLSKNSTWTKLQGMVGLGSVKESVQALMNSIQYNYQRELAEEPLVDFNLNRVFLGSPGTGKTTVAKLYGRILADIGLLSNGEVLVKTPADFVGSVLGASEANTKGILDAAKGKVLVIDEAYGLYAGGGGGGTSDPYKTAVIDTIVAEVHSVPGDDRCVLLLGYKEQMEQMMQNVNPGLTRRFPLDSAFVFEDFSDDELAVIFDAKLKATGFKATPKAREVALEMLKRARNRPHFGNAGEVDIILNDAKGRQQKRISNEPEAARAIFEAHDFDPDHARSERAETNIAKLFEDVIGCDGIVDQLQGYQAMAANMKECGMDPREQLPFNFLFRGPPGTGKTTTARKMGKVYYDMGFLANAQVVDCSAKDLVGEYVGQTGPKTQKLLESALGKVLFIDEAYRLGEGAFAKEAVDELVDCVTKPQFYRKIVVILAGYEKDINRLMDVNPGLSSRFPEVVDFRSMTAEESLTLLMQLFERKKAHIDSSVLSEPRETFRRLMLERLEQLCNLDNFASARDVQEVARTILQTLMKTLKPTKSHRAALSEDLVLGQIDRMLKERLDRASAAGEWSMPIGTTPLQQAPRTRDPPSQAPTTRASTSTAQNVDQQQRPGAKDDAKEQDGGVDPNKPNGPNTQKTVIRDAGVSDEVWDQLQRDKAKEEAERRELVDLKYEEARLSEWLEKCADAAREIELAEIAKRKKALEEKRKREAMEKKKLMQMGRCPVGYEWIKQGGGYRCAGGSHFLADAEVRKFCGGQ